MADQEEIFELVNEEMFESVEQAIPIMWWLVHLLGGEVSFPVDEDFWLENFPPDTRLVLRRKDGKLSMHAEKLGWQ